MENKKFLTFAVLGMFLLLFGMTFVVAQPSGAGSGGADPGAKPVESEFLITMGEFLKFNGENGATITWQDLFIGIAVLIMLFAIVYDILGFTPFETGWVKYLIAIGVALVTSVSGGVRGFAGWMVNFMGGSALLGGFVVFVIAVGFFIVGGFLKGKKKIWKAKADVGKAKAGYNLATAATVAKAKDARAVADAIDGK